MGEIPYRQDARHDDITTLRRFRAEPAQENAGEHEQPEELLVERPISRRSHPRGIEPRQQRQNADRPEQRNHAHELVRDRAQDGVERQVIPFGHDVRRRHGRIGGDIVVGVTKEIRNVEHKPDIKDRNQRNEERVLDGRMGRERNRLLIGLRIDAGRIVLADHMEGPDVQHDHGSDRERQQVMQGEEAVEGRIADRIAAPQPRHDRIAHQRNGGEQTGDDLCGPVAHLAPGQHIAHEPRRHHQEIDDDAENPQHLARRLVGAVIHAAKHVDVAGEEEHRRAV